MDLHISWITRAWDGPLDGYALLRGKPVRFCCYEWGGIELTDDDYDRSVLDKQEVDWLEETIAEGDSFVERHRRYHLYEMSRESFEIQQENHKQVMDYYLGRQRTPPLYRNGPIWEMPFSVMDVRKCDFKEITKEHYS